MEAWKHFCSVSNALFHIGQSSTRKSGEAFTSSVYIYISYDPDRGIWICPGAGRELSVLATV